MNQWDDSQWDEPRLSHSVSRTCETSAALSAMIHNGMSCACLTQWDDSQWDEPRLSHSVRQRCETSAAHPLVNHPIVIYTVFGQVSTHLCEYTLVCRLTQSEYTLVCRLTVHTCV